MDYSKLSDLEINLRVAEIIYPGKKFTSAYSFGEPDGPMVQWVQGYAEYLKLDYCNNAADAWPIMMESHINIEFDLDETFAWGYDQNAQVLSERDRKTFRAAMIVFLMMQGD